MSGLTFEQALQIFKHRQLHPWQRKVLENWSQGKDILVLSGTGAKSFKIVFL
jgi:hypothetical protein